MLDAQSTPPRKRSIIGAGTEHKHEISRFLNQKNISHLHLDWFSPLDWLGQNPFLLEKHKAKIQGIMIAAPEVPKSTWVRLFSVTKNLSVHDVWERLLSKTIPILKDQQINQLGALGFSDWFKDLLIRSNFKQDNSIVVLEWKDGILPTTKFSTQANMRSMRPEDLPEIEQLDHLAFSSLWQNSLTGLKKAFNQPGISTVATQQDQIIGYQISTTSTFQGHLARLAVHPDYQGQQVGSQLLADLLDRMLKTDAHTITVNTQTDNHSSLAIYKKFGFQHTQETIPVYLKHF